MKYYPLRQFDARELLHELFNQFQKQPFCPWTSEDQPTSEDGWKDFVCQILLNTHPDFAQFRRDQAKSNDEITTILQHAAVKGITKVKGTGKNQAIYEVFNSTEKSKKSVKASYYRDERKTAINKHSEGFIQVSLMMSVARKRSPEFCAYLRNEDAFWRICARLFKIVDFSEGDPREKYSIFLEYLYEIYLRPDKDIPDKLFEDNIKAFYSGDLSLIPKFTKQFQTFPLPK